MIARTLGVFSLLACALLAPCAAQSEGNGIQAEPPTPQLSTMEGNGI